MDRIPGSHRENLPTRSDDGALTCCFADYLFITSLFNPLSVKIFFSTWGAASWVESSVRSDRSAA